jgi:hypothetical protein
VKHRVVSAFLALVLLFTALVTFAKPDLCESGCGNLLEPVFVAAYALGGPWGVRAVLLALAGLMFAVVFREKE